MPRRNVPSYCCHKASGQAYIKIDGHRIYLGRYGSPESHQRYTDELAKWQSRQTEETSDVSVKQLTLLYIKFCATHYRKNGKLTSEYDLAKLALRHVNRQCKDDPADKFTPMKLSAIRQAMVESGKYCRKSVNDYVKRIILCWKWGVSQGLVSVSTWQALTTVRALQAGRCDVRESEPVKPVEIKDVEAVRPHIAEPLWGVIQFQLNTASRPTEALRVRLCDIDRSGEVWVYQPDAHKTQHHGKGRVILIGPRGQKTVMEHAGSADPEAFVFSPPKSGGKKPYRRDSYTNSIRRACEKAFQMPEELRRLKADADPELKEKAAAWRKANCWRPNQIRHTAATEIRKAAGTVEAAKTILGHSEIRTSEIYAQRDLKAASEIIKKIG